MTSKVPTELRLYPGIDAAAKHVTHYRRCGSRRSTTSTEIFPHWPPALTIDLDGLGRVLFVHATPRNDTDIVTRRTPIDLLQQHFDAVDADLVVCGHTHMQFNLRVGSKRIVNAGSVGMPFGEPGAHWLLLAEDVALQRTTYDLDAAAARIRESGYPDAAEFAKRYVLAPPSEEEVLALYSRST